jgi:hypothetical protein
MGRRFVQQMAVGQHGVIGQHVPQHALVVVNIDIEIVLIQHPQMVVYTV